jgi:hypothetical protein
MPRPIELLDLPTLYRHRNDAVALDTTRLLTSGNPLGAVGLMAYLNPARHIYSAVANGGTPLFGGVIHTNGGTFAKLLYLAPAADLAHPDLPPLIEHLVAEAGTWGALHVLAEVEERSEAYRALRKAGFSVYAWQRIWDMSALAQHPVRVAQHPRGVASPASNLKWRRSTDVDLPSMQSLYHQIVPALLHPIELAPQHADGLICCADGMRGYVDLALGMYGIVLTPLIHPEATEVGEKLAALPRDLPDRRSRPVYLCVRSYQAWLEPVLEDLGALPGNRQAVMVKHLAHLVKEEQAVKAAQPAGVSVQPSQFSNVEKKK